MLAVRGVAMQIPVRGHDGDVVTLTHFTSSAWPANVTCGAIVPPETGYKCNFFFSSVATHGYAC
jgi:hypothetical protein